MRDPIVLPALPAELRLEKRWARGTDYYDQCGEYRICKTVVDSVAKFTVWHNNLMLPTFDTAQEARECAAKHAEGGHVRI